MGERVKVFLLVAVLGFLAGIVAQLTGEYVLPWLAAVLPQLVQIKFLVSGVCGAFLTLGLVSIWAYVTQSKER